MNINICVYIQGWICS